MLDAHRGVNAVRRDSDPAAGLVVLAVFLVAVGLFATGNPWWATLTLVLDIVTVGVFAGPPPVARLSASPWSWPILVALLAGAVALFIVGAPLGGVAALLGVVVCVTLFVHDLPLVWLTALLIGLVAIGLAVAAVLAVYDYNVPAVEGPVVLALTGIFSLAVVLNVLAAAMRSLRRLAR